MKPTFSTNGLEDFLAQIAKAGNDIDETVAQALDESADILLSAQQEIVQTHRRTGEAYNALKKGSIKKVGDSQEIAVGALDIRKGDKEGFHIIYLEYGTPKVPALHWKRSSIEKNLSKIRATQKAVFQKKGAPLE